MSCSAKHGATSARIRSNAVERGSCMEGFMPESSRVMSRTAWTNWVVRDLILAMSAGSCPYRWLSRSAITSWARASIRNNSMKCSYFLRMNLSGARMRVDQWRNRREAVMASLEQSQELLSNTSNTLDSNSSLSIGLTQYSLAPNLSASRAVSRVG